ncbi:hypothetical protein H1C71_007897, partial [Ictidomys tridecemlineatus]
NGWSGGPHHFQSQHQRFFPPPASLSKPSSQDFRGTSQEMHKEEYEVSVMGGGHTSASQTTTVINMPRDISVPDHVVWSLFNTLFMNFCCLGFIAFAYSVK